MTHLGDQPGDERDDRLAELLSDAVSDVEPDNRLDAIRARTNGSSRRPWLYAVGGAVVATAAVITAIALVGGGSPEPSAEDELPPAAQTDEASDDATEPTPSETSSPSASVVAVYFTGDTPSGPRLYREFLANTEGIEPLAFGVEASMDGTSQDPDYGTLWPDGVSVTVTGNDADLITIRLTGAPAERPAAMSADDARLALQQVVYSAQAALGQGRLPVLIESEDGPTDTILGEPVTEPLQAAPEIEVRAMVNISDPAEGATVSGTFEASGVASSYEATVPWEVRQGDQVVQEGFATAEGWMDKLYPWQTEVDVSGLEPGEYTFVAMTADPSDGEGAGPTIDNRTIVVE